MEETIGIFNLLGNLFCDEPESRSLIVRLCFVVFSPFLRIKPVQRSKRGFKFHEKGKFQQIAQRIRAKV